ELPVDSDLIVEYIFFKYLALIVPVSNSNNIKLDLFVRRWYYLATKADQRSCLRPGKLIDCASPVPLTEQGLEGITLYVIIWKCFVEVLILFSMGTSSDCW